jgi:hypothetical protein
MIINIILKNIIIFYILQLIHKIKNAVDNNFYKYHPEIKLFIFLNILISYF